MPPQQNKIVLQFDSSVEHNGTGNATQLFNFEKLMPSLIKSSPGKWSVLTSVWLTLLYIQTGYYQVRQFYA